MRRPVSEQVIALTGLLLFVLALFESRYLAPVLLIIYGDLFSHFVFEFFQARC